jgi:hypothetical protein
MHRQIYVAALCNTQVREPALTVSSVTAAATADDGHNDSVSVCDSVDSSDSAGDDVDLMYNPQMNCYYDPKTGKYYALK